MSSVGDLIQRPDLIHRLQQFLGLRQASVVPRLCEGVRAVVIMGDVREVGDEKVVSRPCAAAAQLTAEFPALHQVALLVNPVGSGVVLRVHAIESGSALPVLVTLQQAGSVASAIGATFRDQEGSGRIPAGRFEVLNDGPGFPSPHYVMQPRNDRDWGTGWTVFPGHRLRVDSTNVAGDMATEDLAMLWTESTVRSS